VAEAALERHLSAMQRRGDGRTRRGPRTSRTRSPINLLVDAGCGDRTVVAATRVLAESSRWVKRHTSAYEVTGPHL
jgi:hypothetical protein